MSNNSALGNALRIENRCVFYLFSISDNFLRQPAVIALQGHVLTGLITWKLTDALRHETKNPQYIGRISPVIYVSDLFFSHTITLYRSDNPRRRQTPVVNAPKV